MRFWGVLLSLGLAGAVIGGAPAQPPAQPPAPAPAAPERPAERVPVIPLAIGGTTRLTSPFRDTKDPTKPSDIRSIVNENEQVVTVQPIAYDRTTVLLQGGRRGTSRLRLTDVEGRVALFDVVVDFDIQLLRRTIRQVVPTSNVEPILVGGNSNVIILTGNVERPEDIDTIMRTAQTLLGVIIAVPAAPPPGTPAPSPGTQPATPAVFATGPQVINAMRVGGVMQVQLDVVVAEVSRTELRRMSFDFMNFGVHHVFASTPGGAFVIPSSGISGTFPGAPTFTNTVGTVNGAAANFFLALFNPEQDFFGLLQLLRNEELAKILTEPKLITMSGKPATLLSGGEQAVPQPGGLGTTSVQFFPFGTTLSFLPVVLGNGKIHLEVEPEVSTLNAAFGTSISGTIVPGRDVQRVHTTVEMEDGQTFAIGGLIQHQITGSTTKVPVLGDVPFLGVAFSSKSYNELETELLVLVTPHLVDAMSCDQVPKLLPGQETRSPDDFELFLEGILEAPRGPRQVCHNGRYVPAFKNGPTSDLYPCAANAPCGPRCGNGGCGYGNGGCGCAVGVSAAPATPVITTAPAAPAVTVGSPATEETATKTVTVTPGSPVPEPSPPATPVADGKPAALPPSLGGPVGADGPK
jgi:pilus assembly protein CpaC